LEGIVYAFTQDVPIDATFYRRITDGLGEEPPTGLIIHLALARPEGGLRYIDVWESQDDCDRFSAERLHPVVHGLLAEIFGDQLPPEPERVPLPVVHAWRAALGLNGTS
jgi:hypothetical protein